MAAVRDLIAASIGGSAGIVAGQPFDTVKVRLQGQAKAAVDGYKGPIDCIMRVFREEGPRAFFKGMTSPIVANAPINAILFAVENSVIRRMEESAVAKHWAPPVMHWWAGCISGFSQVILACPSELVKIRLQMERSREKPLYTGPQSCIRYILRHEGPRGMLRGWWITAARDTPAFGIYFFSYDSVKQLLGKHVPWTWSSTARSVLLENRPAHMVHERGSSHANLVGEPANRVGYLGQMPIDVMKTLVQSQTESVPKAERGFAAVFRRNYRAEGPGFLFRGLVPTAIRAFPVSAVVFVVYETIHPLVPLPSTAAEART